ncbi:MAG: 50S ribosomal protein L13 [Chloroflexi bacterium]|nr:50S ribosomal protein L13 [Chloroflexota bacterium]
MTTKSTYRLKAGDMDRRWHVMDAAGRPLGRIAGEAARILQGKHKATFEPHMAMGDFVVVVNAKEVDLTGKKRDQKIYYRHTGYPGGLRERSFDEQMAKDPTRVIEKAVKGMLPSGVRGRAMLRMLKVYAGPEHPHAAQLAAGSGARAKKRAEAPKVEAPKAAPKAEAVAAAPAAATSDRLEGALSKYKREELDAEAERLGIEIDFAWNKPDVIEAIQARYDADDSENRE